MYRCVWVPDGRAEPFFPLCPRRPCWTISPGTAAGVPSTRVAASAPNAITPTRSPRSTSESRATCFGNFLTAPSVGRRQDSRRRLPQCSPRNAGGHGVRFARDRPTTARRRVSSAIDTARSLSHSPAVARCWSLPRTGSRTLATHPVGCSPPRGGTRAVACPRTARNRPVLNRRRTYQAADLFWGLFGDEHRTTISYLRISPPISNPLSLNYL